MLYRKEILAISDALSMIVHLEDELLVAHETNNLYSHLHWTHVTNNTVFY